MQFTCKQLYKVPLSLFITPQFISNSHTLQIHHRCCPPLSLTHSRDLMQFSLNKHFACTHTHRRRADASLCISSRALTPIANISIIYQGELLRLRWPQQMQVGEYDISSELIRRKKLIHGLLSLLQSNFLSRYLSTSPGLLIRLSTALKISPIAHCDEKNELCNLRNLRVTRACIM